PLRVPYLAVEETHYRGVGRLVQLLELIHDWHSRDTGPNCFHRVALEDGGPEGNCTKWSCRAHSTAGENTAGVQRVFLRRPIATQVRLGRTAIRPPALVQGTTDAIVVEIPAGRDYLRLDGVVPRTFHLAEIRGAARTHQGLQFALPIGAHNLDLEVAAACRPPQVVGRPTRGQSAGVTTGQDGKPSGSGGQVANLLPPVLYHHETITLQLTRLARLRGAAWVRSRKAMRR